MDDIAVEVIEAKLVSAIDDILSPVKVYQMSPELVSRIAGESEDSRTERELLNRQLAVLGNGLHTCKRFAGFRCLLGLLLSASCTNRTAEQGAPSIPTLLPRANLALKVPPS
jgi:hypothetical protein